MTDALILVPERLPVLMWIEIGVRLALFGVLAWLAVTDPEGGLVLILCGLAALYHLAIAAQLITHLLPGATRLTLDDSGLVWRTLWRDRKVAWSRVTGAELQDARIFSGRRTGVVVILGDCKGVTGTLPIPSLFAVGRNQLLAEMERRRLAHGA
jgi:hypothetical protein